jgi:hypothetical protein
MTAFTQPRPAESPRARRVELVAARFGSAVVLACSLTLLGVAAWLTPSASGVGTHEQLGLRPCGFLEATGYPCMTCGMTTAFAFAAHGQMLSAFHAQPAGAALAILTAVAALVSAYTLWAGIPLGPLMGWFWRPAFIAAAGGALLAAWGYKTLLVRGFL